MYISILFGAAYGIIYGLLLSCVVCHAFSPTKDSLTIAVRGDRCSFLLRTFRASGTTPSCSTFLPSSGRNVARKDYGGSQEREASQLGWDLGFSHCASRCAIPSALGSQLCCSSSRHRDSLILLQCIDRSVGIPLIIQIY